VPCFFSETTAQNDALIIVAETPAEYVHATQVAGVLLSEPLELSANIYGFEPGPADSGTSGFRAAEHITMHNADLKAVNSAKGETVKPRPVPGGANLDSTSLCALLPPASWNVIRLLK
jgi:alpha-L-arabinofuranosidase